MKQVFFMSSEKKKKALAIAATIAALILALALAFVTGARSDARTTKAYGYDLECLTEMHDNPLMECRKEQK